MNPMTITVEVFPVAADQVEGQPEPTLWLLSGTRPLVDRVPVEATTGVWMTMETLLDVGGCGDAVIKHGTSWHEGPEGLRITFMAVCEVDDGELVQDRWPQARPVGAQLLERFGRPKLHAADEPPEENSIAEVFEHGLRHLRHLDAEDATAHEAMPELLRRALEPLAPALARMYMRDPQDHSNVLPFKKAA